MYIFPPNRGLRLGQQWWGAPAAPLVPGQMTTISMARPTPGSGGASAIVRVLDPMRRPVVGAKVTAYGISERGVRSMVDEGFTGLDGVWNFIRGPTPIEQAFRYDLVIRPTGETVGFATQEVTTPNRPATRTGEPISPDLWTVLICPTGEDNLVCEVAVRQQLYRVTYEATRSEWGGVTDPGGGAAAFAHRMAHAAVRNMTPTDSRLQPYFNEKSYGVSDLGIPPQDWPLLVKYYDQTQRVLNSIPWPQFSREAGKITEYFRKCAMGIPVAVDKNGAQLSILSFRLYSPTWSNFFPKTDRELREIFAAAWLANMLQISRCIEHRIRKKARGIERTMHMYSLAALATVVVVGSIFVAGVGPLGSAAFATLVVSESVSHFQLVSQAVNGLN